MRIIPRVLKKLVTSFQVLLLVLLSCVVLGAVMMVIFDELDYLKPTPVEEMVYVWYQNNSLQAPE